MAWRAEVSPAGQDVEYLRQALAEATAGAVRPSAPVTLSREAVDYALKLARIDPRSAAAYHRMAEALLPRLSGPTVSLTQAPGTDLWQRLGSYSAQMGMMDEALGWFRSCAEEEEAQGNAPQCLGAWAVSKSKRGACLAAVLVAGTDAERLSAVIAEPNGMGYMDWITALAVLDLAPKRLDDDRRVRWDSVLLSCMGRDRPAFPDDRRVSITWLDLYKHLAHASSDERLVSAYSAYLQGDPPLRRAVEMLVSAHEQSAKGALLWPDAYTWGAMQSPQDVLKDLGKLLGERGPDLIEAARKASEDTSCRQCESCDPTGLPRGR
jgi:hypothetical protein